MELLLIALIAEEIMTGGAITATLFGGAAGAVGGAVKGVSRNTRAWYAGHRKRLSGHLLGRAWLWVESAVIGLVTGVVTGVRDETWKGVKRAHQLRRDTRQKLWRAMRQRWVQLSAWAERQAEERRQKQTSDDETDTQDDTVSDSQSDPSETPVQQPVVAPDQDPTQPPSADDDDLDELPQLVGDEGVQPMSAPGELAGIVPYMQTWDAPGPTLEEIVATLQMMAAQLTAATDANGKYNVGGEVDAAQALQAAADQVANARELVMAVAGNLHEKYDAAVEALTPVDSDAANEFVGQQ